MAARMPAIAALRGVASQALGEPALATFGTRLLDLGSKRGRGEEDDKALQNVRSNVDACSDNHSDVETEKNFDISAGGASLPACSWRDLSPETPRQWSAAPPAKDVLPMPLWNRDRASWERLRFQACMKSSVARLDRPPRVLCVARRHERKSKFVDFVGEYHLDLIQEFGGVPVIVPRTTRTLACLTEYLPMDGLLVVEGNDISDEVLSKYDCSLPSRLEGDAAMRFASDVEFDVSKDELECALMRYALLRGCPILGLCRGSQMLNVLRGGTLIGDIGTEVSTEIQHLQPAGDTYDSFRHPVHVTGKTPLAEMFRESLDVVQGGDLMVNSYHHQGVRELGSGLVEMARAPDGVLEGFYDPTYDPESGKFVVGLQFHPERMLDDYPGCKRVYEFFIRACSAFRRAEDTMSGWAASSSSSVTEG
eukprot:TRINITY_DN99747_c0_g1_i1.p1 TRINITY_DN99747_c0_g1~~TRINITY_DN99747_c0_g1_i1.p1  ORF type:complete len:422 (-),score=75.46 TRINITY_DN99747_c0_g1_i1:109-1374(-)